MCPLWTVRITGNIRHTVFCVWLPLFSTAFFRFISVLAWIRTSFLLIAQWNSSVWTDHTLYYIFFRWWTSGLFQLWAYSDLLLLWMEFYSNFISSFLLLEKSFIFKYTCAIPHLKKSEVTSKFFICFLTYVSKVSWIYSCATIASVNKDVSFSNICFEHLLCVPYYAC